MIVDSAKPIILGLIGFPLGHSLSPQLHQAILKHTGLSGEYRLLPIPPGEISQGLFLDLFARVRSGEIGGINVTIPYKQAVIPFLDQLSPEARIIGAVNTIFLSDNGLTGGNTDAIGFSRDLFEMSEGFHVKRGTALVLGAGGAARSIVYVLQKAGWNILVASRRIVQAQQLCADMLGNYPSDNIRSLELTVEAMKTVLTEVNLVVNTTPLGMAPNKTATPWPRTLPLPFDAFVYDLIYNPPETGLLRSARQAGLLARNGMGMLIEQAIASFGLWTGQTCPSSILWDFMATFFLPSTEDSPKPKGN